MKNLKAKAVCVMLSASMAAMGLTGCGSDNVDGTKTAITVNDESITLGQANFMLRYQQATMYNYYSKMYSMYGMQMPSEMYDKEGDDGILAEAVPDLVRQPQECLFVLPTGCADYVVENGGHDRVASQPDLLQPDPRYFGGVVQHRRAVVSYLRSGMFGSIFQGAVGCGRLVGRERSADRAAQLVITGQIHFPESFTVFQK